MPPTLRPRKGGVATKDLSSRNDPSGLSRQARKTSISTPTMDPSESSIIHQPGASTTSSSPEENTSADNNLSLIFNLLQTAQDASSSVVQVPADILATLLTSFEDLKKEVKSLQHNVVVDQDTFGMSFLAVAGEMR